MKPAVPTLTSPVAAAITQFINHKRVLGRRYEGEAGELRLFDRYLAAQHLVTLDAITPSVIEAFLRSRRRRPKGFNALRGALDRLFRWMISRELLASSPLRTPPRRGATPRIPFIFSRDQFGRLVKAAARLRDPRGTTGRGVTYRTIFLVLYALGLRVGEVCRLNVGDLDRRRHALLIRHSKFGKDRLVPFGSRIGLMLDQYLAFRRSRRPHLSDDAPMFSVRANRRMNRHSIDRVFRLLLPQLQLGISPEAAQPRVHDIRHSCAVAALLRWYRMGVNPTSRLLHLSTFLGHVQPESTAVYLTITAELLAEGGTRFEEFARPLLKEGRP
jgi:site-specific recombinase XerD